MKKLILLLAAPVILFGSCRDKGPVEPTEKNPPIEITGSIDGISSFDKEKAFFLYALLSPGEEWKTFYIDRDEARLNSDGTIETSREYYWPDEDNMYRFIGIMNSADQPQPDIGMDGPVIAINAGSTPASDLLLSNNLMMRRSSVVNEMEFRHVMTQVVFEMVIDDDDYEEYSLRGKAVAGKQSATYSALASKKTDVATVAGGAKEYVMELELMTGRYDRSPRMIYYLVPDGSELQYLTEVKVNGNDDQDIALVTTDGKPVTLVSGGSYLVQLHISQGIVEATVSLGQWIEESLGDQTANVALGEVSWAVSYPEGFDRITKVEITDDGGRSYFATLDGSGNTLSPADMPSGFKELAVWLEDLRVVLREGEYTLEDGKLDINVIYVGSAEKLAAIATDETTLAGHYRQAADIDLGEGHTPVGIASAPFKGVYDGGGYRITNLRFKTPDINSGLFGVNSGIIKNVTIAKTVVDGLLGVNGMVCGCNNTEGTIEDCVNYADFRGSESAESAKIGGITGDNWGMIRNCANYGNGVSGYSYIGGICGNNGKGSAIESCHNYGDIRMNGGGNSYAGGLTGAVSSQSGVSNSTNHGSVSARSHIGGIAGFAYSSMTDVVNYGNISGTSRYIGGITGYFKSSGIVLSGCINNGTISGNGATGGIAGIAKSGTIVSGCVNNGSINGYATNVGGIAGYVEESCVISKNINKGAVRNTDTGEFADTGGIAGISVAAATFSENVNIAPVTSDGNNTAGIVGDPSNATVELSINTGAITGPADVAGIAGGNDPLATTVTACMNSGPVAATAGGYAAGILLRGTGDTRITACVNTGSITGSAVLGGITAYLGSGAVASCYSVGNVSRSPGSSDPWIGGIAGYSNAPIVSSYWAGAVTTARGIGEAGGDSADGTAPFGENDWPAEDMDEAWRLAANGGYWETLGHWDAANPVYPVLEGLPDIPTP